MLSEPLILFVLQREKKRLEIRKRYSQRPSLKKSATQNVPSKPTVTGLWQSTGAPNNNDIFSLLQNAIDNASGSAVVPQNTNIIPLPSNTNNSPIKPRGSSILDFDDSYISNAGMDDTENSILVLQDEYQPEGADTITALFTTGNAVVTGCYDGTLEVWEYSEQNKRLTLQQRLCGEQFPVTYFLSCQPLINSFVSIGKGHKVHFWDIQPNSSSFRLSEKPQLILGGEPTTCICLWNDMPTVGFRDGTIVAYAITKSGIIESNEILLCQGGRGELLYPTSLTCMDNQLWVGTNEGALLLFEGKTLKSLINLYENQPITSLCAWNDQIVVASRSNVRVMLHERALQKFNHLDISGEAFLNAQMSMLAVSTECDSGVAFLVPWEAMLWTITRRILLAWDSERQPIQALVYGPIACATSGPDSSSGDKNVLFSVGSGCVIATMGGYWPLEMKRHDAWNLQRLLWIGQLKNSKEECCLASLPLSVILRIHSLINE